MNEQKLACCADKIRYANARKAHATAKRIKSRSDHRRGSVYRCRFCAGYHIGRDASHGR